MHDTFVAKGIPVHLGEYGLLSYPDDNHSSRIERGEALKYYEHVGHAARAARVTTALWDPGFAYLNRDTLKWRDPALFAWIKSSWTTRSGTASFDKAFVAKSSPITAKSLTLNRNGTQFRGLWHGDTKLAEGRDYTVFKDRLTLTAPALTRLTGAHATGTAEKFALPTKYRGDQLATMEATYADGTNAGPADWTSYQEFNVAFSPDYPKGTIILTTAFLKSLRDGEPATLTFHFHSGAKVKYKVTKSGDSVSGTAVKES